MKYKCKSCGRQKEIEEFGGSYKPNVSVCWTCKEDNYRSRGVRYRETTREYRASHKDFITTIRKQYHLSTKNKFFEMYGNACACCGETIKEFLTIEHIQGQRGSKKKNTGFRAYLTAVRDYRPDLYEVLCYNCNCVRGKLGYCPHQTHIHE